MVIGRDAHTPDALLDADTEKAALKALRNLGLEPVDTVALRPIG